MKRLIISCFLAVCFCYSFIYSSDYSKDSLYKKLIDENDLNKFGLYHKNYADWMTINGSRRRDIPRYQWVKGDKTLIIEIAEFNSPAEAIEELFFESKSVQDVSYYGSISGPIIGDISWFNKRFSYAGVEFVKNNIAVRALLHDKEDKEGKEIERISKSIIQKIEKEFPVPGESKKLIKKSGVSLEERASILSNLTTQIFSGYPSPIQADSIWVLDTTAYAQGHRADFIDAEKNVWSIDYLKLPDPATAIAIGNERARIAYPTIYFENINNIQYPEIFFKWYKKIHIGSVVFTKGDYAIHIYQQTKTKEIDENILSAMIQKVAQSIP